MSKLLKEYFDEEEDYLTESEGEYYSDEEETPHSSELVTPGTAAEFMFDKNKTEQKMTLDDIVETKEEQEKYYKQRVTKRAKETAKIQQQEDKQYNLTPKLKEELLEIQKEQNEVTRKLINEQLKQGLAQSVNLGMHVIESNKFEISCPTNEEKEWTFKLAIYNNKYCNIRTQTEYKIRNLESNKRILGRIPLLEYYKYAFKDFEVEGKVTMKQISELPGRMEPFKYYPSKAERVLSITSFEQIPIGEHIYLIGNSMSGKASTLVLKMNMTKHTMVLYDDLWQRRTITNRYRTPYQLSKYTVFKDFRVFPTFFQGTSSIFVFGGSTMSSASNMEGYVLCHVEDDYLIHWQKVKFDERIPKLSGYSIEQIGNRYYLYGGREKSNTMNPYIFVLNLVGDIGERNEPYVMITQYFSIKEDYITSPSLRENHCSFLVGGMIYIYGGYNSLGVPLNDLYQYDTTMNQFTKINMKGAVPPPIKRGTAFAYSNFAFIYSLNVHYHEKDAHHLPPSLKNQKNHSSIYRFSFATMSWDYLNLPRQGIKAQENSNCIPFKSGILYFGNKDDKKSLCYLSNLSDTGKAPQRFLELYKAAEDQYYTDVILKVSFEEKGETYVGEIYAHQAILAARCKSLASQIDEAYALLEDEDDEEDDQTYVYGPPIKVRRPIVLDFKAYDYDVVKAYIEYLYTGGITLKSNEQGEKKIKQLINLAEKLSPKFHYFFISRICNKRSMDLGWVRIIYDDISKSYLSLLHDARYCDFELMTEDGSSLPCHRLFLTRLSHFRSIIDAGMLESIEGRAMMRNMEPEVLKIFIDYLYSDQIEVSLDWVVPTLIHSFQLSLRPISRFCRNIVREALTTENVLDVHEVAMANFDNILKSVTTNFMSQPSIYEKIKFDTRFSLPEFEDAYDACEKKWIKYERKRNQLHSSKF